VHDLRDLRDAQRRHATPGVGPRLGEPVQVRLEQGARFGQCRHRPARLGVADVAADEQAVALAAEIHDVVRVAHGRHPVRRAAERLRHHVLVLDGHDGHGDAGHPSDVAGRDAGAVHDHLGRDPPVRGEHRADRAVDRLDPLDPDAGEQRRAEGTRSGGERLCQAGRFEVTVAGEPPGGEHVIDVQRRGEVGRLRAVEQVQVQPVRGRRADLPAQFGHPFRGGREPQAADAAPARVEPGAFAQLGVQRRRVHDHLGLRDGRPQLADEAGRMPRGSLGQVVLLHEHDVGPSHPRQVVGDAAARDATADDDGAGTLGEIGLHGGVITPRGGRRKAPDR
jgi:hypothetical protein